MFASWYNMAMLAAESQHVIGLRLMKIAAGGTSGLREAELMISEKIAAATQATNRLMMGMSPDSVVDGYRKKVRANVRRLSK